jgi:methylase of polypeptide subunit release factors
METISLKYEPPIALFTGKKGLEIYEKFLKQIKTNLVIGHRSSVICFFEIDPRQKKYFTKLIKNIFSKAKPIFHKDLAGRWRVCEVEM